MMKTALRSFVCLAVLALVVPVWAIDTGCTIVDNHTWSLSETPETTTTVQVVEWNCGGVTYVVITKTTTGDEQALTWSTATYRVVDGMFIPIRTTTGTGTTTPPEGPGIEETDNTCHNCG